MLQYLDRLGVSSADVARDAGITVTFPAGPDARIPGSQVERLWSIAIDRTRDPLIGMHMAEAYSPGALDILGYVVLSCATVGEVLDRLARYARILNNGMQIDVERDGRMAICRCIFIESTDNYLLRNPEQAVDSMWVGLARELRRLTATPLLASEVWFRRPAPPAKARSEYERVFASRLTFGAVEDRFILPVTHLDAPVLSANPSLLHTFEQHADAVLAGMDKQGSKSQLVAKVLAAKLKGAAPPLSVPGSGGPPAWLLRAKRLSSRLQTVDGEAAERVSSITH